MPISITILGSNSAVPSTRRWTSSQYFNIDGNGALIDCGEGTQLRLKMFKIKLQSINQVFITHLHGDHFFGLVGLVSTFHLLGRSKPLTIFGPKELEYIINYQLEISNTILGYKINFVQTNPNETEVIFDDKKFYVTSFPLDHSVATTGFLIKEKKRSANVRENKDSTDNKTIVRSSYCYCSDTRYKPEIAAIINNCDVLYHEATFMSSLQQMATEKYHATAKEAALIAKEANVKKLILGHFSKRYRTLDDLLAEAQEIFPETILAEDGMKLEI